MAYENIQQEIKPGLVDVKSVMIGHTSLKYDDAMSIERVLSFIILELSMSEICTHPHTLWQNCVSSHLHSFLHNIPKKLSGQV